MKRDRKSIRYGIDFNFRTFTNKKTTLYGQLSSNKYIKAYCENKKCYLTASQIKEKQCNKKKCKYLKEINKLNDNF